MMLHRFLAVSRLWLGLVLMSCTLVSAADPDGKLRIVVFGAHPDDAEYKAGGSAIQWARLGHEVLLCSVTNGDIGHWRNAGGELAQRRAAEVKACGELWGTTSMVLDIHDGELLPTLENRKKITRVIREWQADLVIAHRPWDYHPDHRYVGVLVQDAAFMVTVPFFCPDVPALKKNPVFMYSSDGFQKPYPFAPTIAVALPDDVMEQKVRGIHLLPSQAYEGGANGSAEHVEKNVPPAADETARLNWLRRRWQTRNGGEAQRYRDMLIQWYGPERGPTVRFAECFELCEYGARPSEGELRRLFPFFE